MSVSLHLPNACLETLPDLSQLPLEELDIHGNRLTSLEGLPLSLKILDGSQNWLLHDGIYFPFPSLEYLNFSHNRIHSIEEDDFVMCYPTLKNLNISYNSMRHIDCFKESLIETLNISHNRISLVSRLPESLKVLRADTNEISIVQSKLPPNLECLELSYNMLRYAGLPLNWPSTLRELHLSHNKIERFPRKLPDSLEVLCLSKNKLTELPLKLPSSLHTLVVFSNRIRYLPSYSNHKKFQLFLIHDNCLTETPETYNAKVFTGHENWQEHVHIEAQRVIKRCWKRYVLTLRLRHYKRTQRTKDELFTVSMMPERWEQIDALDPVWFRKHPCHNRTGHQKD